ncbi:hypothetical protein BKA70DRAFT_668024 [Coprinopsis sp. MPI-PUGE-AT-0042]|nr:hypothetical protein BKA70DRAFT_668024 [Coprinopsis sp. MPI-PUGE-AT-0042]
MKCFVPAISENDAWHSSTLSMVMHAAHGIRGGTVSLSQYKTGRRKQRAREMELDGSWCFHQLPVSRKDGNVVLHQQGQAMSRSGVLAIVNFRRRQPEEARSIETSPESSNGPSANSYRCKIKKTFEDGHGGQKPSRTERSGKDIWSRVGNSDVISPNARAMSQAAEFISCLPPPRLRRSAFCLPVLLDV